MELRGKQVLVTGADGFIGSHLTEILFDRGAKITALAQYNSFNRWGWLEAVDCRDQIKIVAGDIRDAHFVRRISKGMDAIFHLAALIAIPFSYTAPDSYVQTNVLGTLNVLQAALDHGIGRIVHTSTSEVYGTARYVPIDEKHPLQAQSPYSATKISADALAFSYYSSFQLPVTIVRPFNTYGPRQSARAVISTIITQMLADKKKVKLGSLHPTRDFNYVDDTCRGFIELAECDAAVGETVNIGSGSEVSIGDLFARLKTIIGSEAEVESDAERVRPESSEVERLQCDNGKIHMLTGFRPQVSLEAGLRKTVAWFENRENAALYKADIYNV
jgi:NAD dependent epimerase/dehydratase